MRGYNISPWRAATPEVKPPSPVIYRMHNLRTRALPPYRWQYADQIARRSSTPHLLIVDQTARCVPCWKEKAHGLVPSARCEGVSDLRRLPLGLAVDSPLPEMLPIIGNKCLDSRFVQARLAACSGNDKSKPVLK